MSPKTKLKIEPTITETVSETKTDPMPASGLHQQWAQPYLNKQTLLICLLSLLVVSSLIYAYLGHRQNAKIQTELANLQTSAKNNNPQNEINNVLAQVGSLMVLPEGEQPAVATVVDLAKLEGKPFFKNAQLGDKVIIYSQAGKAILYVDFERVIDNS